MTLANLLRTVTLVCFLGASVAAARTSGSPDVPTETNTPGLLTVLIVVDGLGADVLGKYLHGLDGGFPRLMNEGVSVDTARHDHGLLTSAPGHVTLATGVHPSRHGIVDNDWVQWIDEAWRGVGNSSDPEETLSGFPELRGHSPRKRRAASLPEWIAERDPGSRVISIGQGPLSANSLASRNSGLALWSDAAVGGFVTSTFYAGSLPAWVQSFNAKVLPRFTRTRWVAEAPQSLRSLARADAAPFEGWEEYGGNDRFPHDVFEEVEQLSPQAYFSWFRETPFHDEALAALARSAILELNLGQRGRVDYLGLNFSGIDNAAHGYGPGSLETLDALWRLDIVLEEFIGFLTDTLGRDGFVLALSADHGAPEIPESASERGAFGYRVSAEDIARVLEAARSASEQTGAKDERAVSRAVAQVVAQFPFVADAITLDELEEERNLDEIRALYRNSHYPGRRVRLPILDLETRESLAPFGVVVRLREGAGIWFAPSAHLSPTRAEREVPLFFMGRGVRPGRTESARTVDVAPTLACLAEVTAPGKLDGTVIAAVCPDA